MCAGGGQLARKSGGLICCSKLLSGIGTGAILIERVSTRWPMGQCRSATRGHPLAVVMGSGGKETHPNQTD